MKKLLFLLMFLSLPLLANDDMIWWSKTDQMDGFYMVKFSNTDSLIVGHGYQMDLFYDAKTGQEIKRIPFNAEVYFIDNDRKFVRLAPSRNKLEIFDTDTFEVIDSLEHDDSLMGSLYQVQGSIDISSDERYIIGVVKGGIRLWDLQTKKIIKTKIFPPEPNLIYYEVDFVTITCDDSKFIGHTVKIYEDPKHPGQEKYYSTYGYNIIYDLHTFDSLDVLPNARSIRLSNDCKKFALSTGDVNYGVEVYDFNTKEQLWKLPINGPSLTGIEFSPDDKYLVTSPTIKIWSMETGKEVYSYVSGSSNNIDISHNGKYIVSSIGDLFLWHAKFGTTSVEDNNINSQNIIFPNPTSGLAILQFGQIYPEITNITLSSIKGEILKTIFSGFLEVGNQEFPIETKSLPIGTYIISIQNKHNSLSFKLIVNK